MYLKVEQAASGRFSFSLMSGEKQLFSSTDESIPFLGDYGDYASVSDANKAASLFAFRNFDILTRLAQVENTGDIESDEIKSRAVVRFRRGLKVFLEILDQIRESKKKGNLKQRVRNLKTLVDQYAKALLETARTLENDERVNDVPDEIPIQEVSLSKLKSPYARDLIEMKHELRKFYHELKRDFGEYLEVSASGVMSKIMTTGEISWFKDILVELGEDVAGSLPVKGSELDSIVKRPDGYDVNIKTSYGFLTLSFSSDLILDGVHPQEGLISLFPPMSQRYYNSIWFPVFRSVGNFRVGSNVVAIPVSGDGSQKIGCSENGKYLENRFKAYDLDSYEERVVDVFLDNEDVMTATCSFVVASRKPNRDDTVDRILDIDQKILMSAKMVKCNVPGKYEGVAGEIIHSGIKRYPTYIDVPVRIKFDNGIEEVVVFTSDMIEVYA